MLGLLQRANLSANGGCRRNDKELQRFTRSAFHGMTTRASIALGAFACGWLLGATAHAQDERVQRGYAFAQANCASCHAIGRTGTSPLPAAPTFRALHLRYPVENLAEALAEGIVTGHPAMPQFRLEVGEIGDLIAYLKSLGG